MTVPATTNNLERIPGRLCYGRPKQTANRAFIDSDFACLNDVWQPDTPAEDGPQHGFEPSVDADSASHRPDHESGKPTAKPSSTKAATLIEKLRRQQEQLDDQRAQLQAERKNLRVLHEELKTESESLNAAKAAFLDEFALLHEERQELVAERMRLSDQFAQLRGVRKVSREQQATASAASLSWDPTGERPLRIILEPGAATATQIAELLQELTRLFQHLGGAGLRFEVSRCKCWQAAVESAHRKSHSHRNRFFVEILLLPRVLRDAPSARDALGQWDRLESCLYMSLRLDAGLAETFDLGDVAAADHHAQKLVAHAVELASTTQGGRTQQPPGRLATGLSLDSVNEQLQRIKELRGRLERQQRMIVELAPLGSAETDGTADMVSTVSGRRTRPSGRLKTLLAAAAMILIVAGICAWPSISQRLARLVSVSLDAGGWVLSAP